MLYFPNSPTLNQKSICSNNLLFILLVMCSVAFQPVFCAVRLLNASENVTRHFGRDIAQKIHCIS